MSSWFEPTPQMLRQRDKERLARANRMTPGERMLAGAALFDMACEISKAGIRHQFPQFNEQQVLEELRRRIKLGEKLRDKGG
jgi:hypothetical protein